MRQSRSLLHLAVLPATHTSTPLRKLILILCFLAAAAAPAVAQSLVLLYEDDFESFNPSNYVPDSGQSQHYGQVVMDPVQGDSALSFSQLESSGDMLTAASFSHASNSYVLELDYYGDSTQGGNPGNLGGFIRGYNASIPWLVGTTNESPNLMNVDNAWTHITVTFTGVGPISLSFEDYAGSGGVAGDFYFDNVKLWGGVGSPPSPTCATLPAPSAFWSFDDGANPTQDGTLNGHDGTLVGPPLFSTDVPAALGSGKSMCFNGTTNYVALDMSFAATEQIPAITVSVWFKTSFATNGSIAENWAFLDFDRSEFFNLSVTPTGQIFFATSTDLDLGGFWHQDMFSVSSGLNDNNWHNVIAVYDGTDKRIYIDGSLDSAVLNPHGGHGLGRLAGLTRYGFIGDGSEAPSFNGARNNHYYEGKMDEVAFWETALTPAQISCVAGGGTIIQVGSPPVADAGIDFNVDEGQPGVMLDGSLSMDADGDALSYSWAQLAGGPSVMLTGANTATPSFDAPALTTGNEILSFELTVTANGESSTDSVSVTVIFDQPPVATAGTDFSVDEGQAGVMLDGSGSDTENEPLSYLWVQLAGGTPVTLSDATIANPSFDAPLVALGGETLSFKLTVTAGQKSSTDEVSVTIVNVNHPPVADAGNDDSVAEGTPDVTLHGEDSFDIDNDTVFYSWVQIGGPTVTLSGDSTANPTFDAPIVASGGAPGVVATLVFQLAVHDGFPSMPNDLPAPGYCFANSMDTVTIEITNVNNAPTAEAGAEQTVDENTMVSLNGGSSNDPDGDTLSYSWSQTGGPVVIGLSGETTATPGFIVPFVSPGGVDVTFKLTVNDGYGGADTDNVIIHVKNANDPPLVSAAAPTIGSLWPPNHRMVEIGIIGVSDPDDNATITIDAVFQDEPTNGTGDGDTAIDAIINADGTVLIRAERDGGGNGRVYHIHFTASDLEGSASGVVTVSVNKKRKQAAVDDGQLYDSTLP